MSEEKKTKALKYQIAKGYSLTFPGFPYTITNELLQGPHGDKHVVALQNYEKERDVTIFGKLIVLK